MVQTTYPFNKLNKVSYRDLGANSIMKNSNRDGSFKNGCYHRPKEEEPLDVTIKKAGFSLATNGNVGSRTIFTTKRNFSTLESKVKPLNSEESIALYSSLSRRGKISSNIRRKSWHVENPRDSPVKRNLRNVASLRAKIRKPTQQRDERPSNRGVHISVNKAFKDLSPRGKVLEVARHFKTVFEELDRDRAAWQGSRIDFKTRNTLIGKKMRVNNRKMIGPVPGIKVGDVFQFKSVLNLIGLHFDIRGGIDYMDEEGLKLATSIVSAEGNGYKDGFGSNVMIYYGQGGNVISNDYNLIEDQKLVKGNLALANSMEAKTPVRVICGKKRKDGRGKDYVYNGLYLVDHYRQARGRGGKIVFKFKLCRVFG